MRRGVTEEICIGTTMYFGPEAREGMDFFFSALFYLFWTWCLVFSCLFCIVLETFHLNFLRLTKTIKIEDAAEGSRTSGVL